MDVEVASSPVTPLQGFQRSRLTMVVSVQYYNPDRVSKKTCTPVTFWHTYTNAALMSLILGKENLHLNLN